MLLIFLFLAFISKRFGYEYIENAGPDKKHSFRDVGATFYRFR